MTDAANLCVSVEYALHLFASAEALRIQLGDKASIGTFNSAMDSRSRALRLLESLQTWAALSNANPVELTLLRSLLHDAAFQPAELVFRRWRELEPKLTASIIHLLATVPILADNERSVLRALNRNEPTFQIFVQQDTSISKNVVSALLNRLSTRGLVHRIGDRKGWLLTNLGFMALRNPSTH